MDAFRQSVKDEIIRANRAPFGGWWEMLLEIDPELLRRVHEQLKAAEEIGPISVTLRHLIWVAVDAVVTHLFTRGCGIHAKIAIEEGATRRQVLETLEIAAIVSGRGYGVSLPIVVEEIIKSGRVLEKGSSERAEEVRSKFSREMGAWPDWMETAVQIAPDALEGLLNLGYDRADQAGLDPKSRALIFLAANSCPAILEREAIRTHTRQALELGATQAELVQTLLLANSICLHSISEGVLQLRANNLA